MRQRWFLRSQPIRPTPTSHTPARLAAESRAAIRDLDAILGTQPCTGCGVDTPGAGRCNWCARWEAVETRAAKLGIPLPARLGIDDAEHLIEHRPRMSGCA
jgi:hypothetical protein